ncbi:hypothetical protein Tco_0688956 [Tanacetum coccineum]
MGNNKAGTPWRNLVIYKYGSLNGNPWPAIPCRNNVSKVWQGVTEILNEDHTGFQFTKESFIVQVENWKKAKLEKPSETQDQVEYDDGVWYSTCDRECLKNEERIVIHIFSKAVDQGSALAAELEAICEALLIEIGRRELENKQIVIWCNSSGAVNLTNGEGTPWYRASDVDILAKHGISRSRKLVLGISNGEVDYAEPERKQKDIIGSNSSKKYP